MSFDTDRILALEREAEQHVAVIEELRRFVQGIIDHGLRADFTPTMSASQDMYVQWSRYLQRIDAMVREQAKQALRLAKRKGELPRGNHERFADEARRAPDPSPEAQEIAKWIHRMEWRGDPIGARYIEAMLASAGRDPQSQAEAPRKQSLCAHCGLPRRGVALAEGKLVCHTGPPWPDCYRLITVYGEKLGSRLPREES